jgi:hypothetical protein
MATIITVHGTFAAGTEDGEDWWQRGSAFERDIRKLVETQDGILHFQPYIWDGANSELSRRAAAKGLSARVSDLNNRNEPYCLIGHSHGGSVVARTVFDLCADKATAKMLSRWITVGTPFVSMTKRKLLVSRLGLFGKTLYLTCFLLCMWAAALYIHGATTPFYARKLARREDINVDWDASLVIRICFIIVIFSLPFLLAHLCFLFVERRKMRIHSKKRWKAFTLWAGSRWAGFWHVADEAMQGLKSAPQISFPIFSDRFLVAPLSLATVFASPPLLALGFSWLLYGQEGRSGSLFASGPSPLGPENPFSAIGIIFEWVSGAYSYIFRPPSPIEEALGSWDHGGIWPSLLAAGTLVLAFVLLALLLLAMVALISRVLSVVLSRTLDRVTWAQLRQSVFGNDTIGEIAAGTDARPMWYNNNPLPLPTELGQELSEHADLAAARSLSKLRSAVQVLAFSEERREKSDLLSEYLTWEELIHTSYFSVSRFRMLIAYTIAHSPGFQPTAAFKNHPDYELVAQWYAKSGFTQPKFC